MGTFAVVTLDQFIYDMVMYADDDIENCDLIMSSVFANELLWISHRFLCHIVWVFPIIYVFWPETRAQRL